MNIKRCSASLPMCACVCVYKCVEGAAAVCCKSVADKLLSSDLLQGGTRPRNVRTVGLREREEK